MMPQSRPTGMGVRDASTAAEFAALGRVAGTRDPKAQISFRVPDYTPLAQINATALMRG
jgi:hypothetical protein